jgi:hypothetical protein
MDNQATKYIKQFLNKKKCKLQLVEPHKHCVNATEWAIQMFKDAFLAALATTDGNFPIQLWDRLTPQVQNTLNMLRASRANPAILAYEALNGPYNWNRYPLAPLGCKAVIYEDGNTRGSWASRGIVGWYLGLSLDHYRCNVYHVPETRVYGLLGSTKLFPQHCQLPTFTPHQHLRELTDELAAEGTIAGMANKGHRLLTLLQTHIGNILTPQSLIPAPTTEHRVEQRVSTEQQRVIDDTPIITLQCITDAPAIMASCNPTAKRNIKTTPVTHLCVTRNNTPGGVPWTKWMRLPTVEEDNVMPAIDTRTQSAIPMARSWLVLQQALNTITMAKMFCPPPAYTPRVF